MAGGIAHFAINADDVERARGFYENVFGWSARAWGPPGFYQLRAAGDPDGPVLGAVQRRRELAPGLRLNAFECTIGVEDVDAVAAAVLANGGRILMERADIPGVGSLIFFADPEGNVAGAMQYVEGWAGGS
jgi:predicted enzyme related to lactoylglutathione lyase